MEAFELLKKMKESMPSGDVEYYIDQQLAMDICKQKGVPYETILAIKQTTENDHGIAEEITEH